MSELDLPSGLPAHVLDELARFALLGMRQAGPLPPLALGEESLDQLLLELGREGGAGLAQRAQLLFQVRAVAAPLPTGQLAPLPPLPAETRPMLPLVAVPILESALVADDAEALMVLLQGTLNYCLPGALLAALPEAFGSSEWQQFLAGFAAPHLAWLARQHPDWAWLRPAALAAGLTPTALQCFNLGTGLQRARALTTLRLDDPVAALELLQTGWSQTPPEARALLLPCLRTGLGASDEGFLESVLGDRRKEVRSLAVDLLLSLPDSALRQRARARVRALLDWDPVSCRLHLRLPGAHDATMQRDGIEARPTGGKGERGFWLQQLLAQLSLADFAAQLGLAPGLVPAVLAQQEDAALLLATQLSGCERRQDQHEALLWLQALEQHPLILQSLLKQPFSAALMHDPELQQWLRLWLAEAPIEPGSELETALLRLLSMVPAPWPVHFAHAVLDRLVAHLPVRTAPVSAAGQAQRLLAQQCRQLLALRAEPEAFLFERCLALADTGLSRRELERLRSRLHWRRQLHLLVKGEPR